MNRLPARFPFAPEKWPFFYGWVIVGASTIGIVMSIPGQTMGVSVFTDHLIRVTGLTRLDLAYTYLVGTLGSSLLLPCGGVLLDRYGARWTAIAACIAVAGTLCVLTQLDHVASVLRSIFGFETLAPAAAMVLAIGFMMLRFSGQGMLTMASRTMMAKWFERRRGLASAVSGIFVSGGFAIAPVILLAFIDFAGWRGAWWILAGCVGIGMSLVALVFFRENPEESGLRMDGRPPTLAQDSSPIDSREGLSHESRSREVDEPEYTREEALRTACFWVVTLAISLQAMVFTGVTFHIVDLGLETGIGGREAVQLFIPIAIVSTAVGMISGWAADRVPVRILVLAFLAFQTVGYVGAGRLGETPFLLMMLGGWGGASGLFATLLNVAIPNFFGRLHLGAISSIQMSLIVAASAVGPALLAASKAYIGSYRQGLLFCCLLSIGVFVFAAVAPFPSRTRVD